MTKNQIAKTAEGTFTSQGAIGQVEALPLNSRFNHNGEAMVLKGLLGRNRNGDLMAEVTVKGETEIIEIWSDDHIS